MYYLLHGGNPKLFFFHPTSQLWVFRTQNFVTLNTFMDTQRQSVGAQTVSVKTTSGVGFSGAKRGRLAWFDIRVIYVRLSSCLAKSAPDCFRVIFPPRSLTTAFEVNGGRIAPSDQTSRALRRDRVDKDSAEATYVSTDNLRTNGDLPFELHHRGEVLVTGKFLRSDSWSKGPILDNHACSFTTTKKPWIMDCNCALSAGSSFLSTKTEFSVLNAPFLEVYVAGRSLGQPIVLNQMVHLLPRRKLHSHTRCISLEAIPEDDDETGNASHLHTQEEVESEMDLGNYSHSNSQAGLEIFYFGGGGGGGEGFDDMEGEEGELTWFNAGVRVGMGIGMGICLGIGVGVGLVMRTYQATTGRFRRRLL